MKTSSITANPVYRGWGNYFTTETVLPLTRRQLQRPELGEAARLLGRGMRDNPANIRAFGIRDTERRSWALARFFRPVLHGLYQRGLIWGAFRDGILVGVCGMARPGLCQPSALEKLRVVPSVVFGNPVGTPLRVLRWVGEWARRDPHRAALAPGPSSRRLAPPRPRKTARVRHSCVHKSRPTWHRQSYLETDKSENVRFYEKFGFTVIAEAEILGIPNWFMMRASAINSPKPDQSCEPL